MKFIIDNKIPYIKGALEPFGDVVYLSAEKTTPEALKDADTIITRTRTICDEKLLKDSSIKFIATATIGFDHIDTNYCDKNGIKWSNAPGCNSKSVEQYITSSLFVLAEKRGFQLKGKTIGIVGVGQVGSKIAQACKILGMNVLLNDPPRERKERKENFVSLEEIAQKSDIISLHTPLNMEGDNSTFHLANEEFFNTLQRKPILINSARGAVVDNQAAKRAIQNGKISGLVLDCWENEPNIDIELLEKCDLATPHIAGYSKEGKANGTSMSIQAISKFFNLGIDNWQAKNIELPDQTIIELDGFNISEENIIGNAILATYDIRIDDQKLRGNPKFFEKLRGDYPVRREYPVFTVKHKNLTDSTIQKLKLLGFKVEE